MAATRSASISGKGKGPSPGKGGDSEGNKLSTDEKLDNIYELLNSMRVDMKTQIKKLGEEIREENKELVERLEGRVFDLEAENEELKQIVLKLEKQVLESDNRVLALENKHNDLEQYGRKNSIRITGIEDSNKFESVEETVTKVIEFANTELNVDITSADIDTAHRLGTFRRNNPRAIICKFTQRRKKFEVIQQRKLLKGKKQLVYEDLTRVNQQRLKEAFNLECVENSWSVDGKLFLKLKNGKKRRISHDTILSKNFLLNDNNFH